MKNKKKAILLSVVATASLLACGKINDSIGEDETYTVIETVENTKTVNNSEYELKPLSLKEDVVDFNMTDEYAYVKDDTSLYNLNEEFVCSVEKYQKVKIIATNGIISAVELDDTRGFINNNELVYLPKDFIDVDISDQLVTVYNESEEVLKANVVTGCNGHETNIGYQEILEKTYNRPLIGPTWNVHVDYFFPFNYDGEGFRDASWRSEFGGEIYKNSGSHGCVNMNYDDVEKMDEYIEVGTKVLVHK